MISRFKYILLVLCLAFSSLQSQTLQLKLLEIEEVPFSNMGDSIYWNIVKGGLNNMPSLIELLNNSKDTNIPVRYFGRNFTIADLAYFIITDIIQGIPTYDLLEKAGCKIDKEKGFGNYWDFLCGSNDNRRKFRVSVKEWFSDNKDSLTWIKTDMHAYADLSEDEPFDNPAGGYYILKKK